jgi:hypothetical protein
MTFDEAENKFRELRARIQQGESIGTPGFEEQVGQLAVIFDEVWWEIHPYTGRWNYFDGMEWIESVPPGRPSSIVEMMPARSRSRVMRGRTSVLDSQNRLWIGFAIAAVSMCVCGIVLLFTSRWLMSVDIPVSTPTQVAKRPTATPTEIATETPTPTVLPTATATPIPVLAKITGPRVNVRAAPTTDAQIIGKVVQGDQVTLIGRNGDSSWFQVRIPGVTEPSWISASTMQVTTGDANQLPVVP